jgi:hypothetical protein
MVFMDLHFSGIATTQKEKPAKGNYPASVDVTFLDVSSGAVLTVNSPIAVNPADLFKTINYVLLDYRAQIVDFERGGVPAHFLKHSCKAITGSKA